MLARKTDTLLFDLVHLLEVSRIKVNKKDARFEQKDDKIFITAGSGFQAGKQVIKIEYGGEPPVAAKPPWFGGFTWTKDKTGNPWVVINCQKEGEEYTFPVKTTPAMNLTRELICISPYQKTWWLADQDYCKK